MADGGREAEETWNFGIGILDLLGGRGYGT